MAMERGRSRRCKDVVLGMLVLLEAGPKSETLSRAPMGSCLPPSLHTGRLPTMAITAHARIAPHPASDLRWIKKADTVQAT